MTEHKELASGKWAGLPLVEQMAHIGSEVERALNWRNKMNREYSQKAFERALELLDLSLSLHTTFPRLKELARVREFLVDYFLGTNEYGSREEQLRSYFLQFATAARLKY